MAEDQGDFDQNGARKTGHHKEQTSWWHVAELVSMFADVTLWLVRIVIGDIVAVLHACH